MARVTTTKTTPKAAAKAPKAVSAGTNNGNNGSNGSSVAASTRKTPWRQVTNEERHQMIQFAAYMKAQNRGFAGGDAFQDWINAEREVDAWLKSQTKASQA